MRCCWILLFLPVFAGAQHFSAADLRQLKTLSTGVFANNAPAGADAQYVKTGLTLQPIWTERKDGLWVFAERTDTARKYQLWHFYLQDDTTFVLQFLSFKDTLKAAQLSRDSKQQSNLYVYNLFTIHGCEVYLKKNKTGYSGSSAGKECFTNVPGTEYLLINMGFTKNSIVWQEMGFDKDDKAVSSSVNSSDTFTRQSVKSSK